MIDPQIAAAIAFAAMGANVMGGVVLLLLNAGSRSVRWYLPFQCAVILWLFSQAATFVWPSMLWDSVHAFGIVVLPLMFLLFAIFEAPRYPSWYGIIALLVAAPVLPFAMRGLYGNVDTFSETLTRVWMYGGWLGGSVMLWLRGRREARMKARKPGIRREIVLLAFVLVAPLSIVAAILFDGVWFIIYAMPIVTVWVMFLIFYGVTRMQFYDIEVRVRRSGDVAAESMEMERMAVLGQLAATIAHEVRNPLTGVRSLAQRIAEDDVPADKRRRYGEVILEETGRVERLVSNLLELARRHTRRDRDSSATVELTALFDDVTLLVASRAERARIQLATDAGGLSAAAQREPLMQIMLNLVLNAIAHSPHNTIVKVAAMQRGDGVDIVVRDQGAGVPAADRERIFDAFYTTGHKGTGLGLSVVRHLAKENGWTISVADAPGGGAEFKLSL